LHLSGRLKVPLRKEIQRFAVHATFLADATFIAGEASSATDQAITARKELMIRTPRCGRLG